MEDKTSLSVSDENHMRKYLARSIRKQTAKYWSGSFMQIIVFPSGKRTESTVEKGWAILSIRFRSVVYCTRFIRDGLNVQYSGLTVDLLSASNLV